MATLTKAEIASLSVEERLTLIDDLWDSLENIEDIVPTPAWHKELLDQRFAEAERSPKASIPWEVVKAELTKKYLS